MEEKGQVFRSHGQKRTLVEWCFFDLHFAESHLFLFYVALLILIISTWKVLVNQFQSLDTLSNHEGSMTCALHVQIMRQFWIASSWLQWHTCDKPSIHFKQTTLNGDFITMMDLGFFSSFCISQLKPVSIPTLTSTLLGKICTFLSHRQISGLLSTTTRAFQKSPFQTFKPIP